MSVTLRSFVGKVRCASLTSQSWLVLMLAFLLFLVRRPQELLVGYFYAEEGATYFRYAWDSKAIDALLAPHQGYYSLYPNATMLFAARVLPIKFAAVFGAWCALAIILLMVFWVTQCELLRTFEERSFAVLVCLFCSPGLTMALSTINSQYFLAICTAVVLFSSTNRWWIFRTATLILAGLTGVVSCFLLPFFCVKAFSERSARRTVQAALLFLCCVLQAGVVLRMSNPFGGAAPHHSVRVLLDAFLVNSPLMEFGSRITSHIAGAFLAHHPGVPWTIAAVLCAGVIVALARVVWDGGNTARLLFGMGVFSGMVSLSATIGGGDADYVRGSMRYLVVCNALIGFSLLSALQKKDKRAGQRLSILGLLLCTVLFSGAVDIPTYQWTMRCEPSWPAQVKRWNVNDRIALEVGPVDWGHSFLIQHAHPKLGGLPSSIYDSVKNRHTVVLTPVTPTPCRFLG